MATRCKMAVCQRIRNAILGRRHRSSRASIEKSSAVLLTNVAVHSFSLVVALDKGNLTEWKRKGTKNKNPKNNDNQ